MLLGYNTNGLAHHWLHDAIELLAAEGYQSVAITLDAGALDPYGDPRVYREQSLQVRSQLDSLGLSRVVETGARYLLNPHKKHDPTLMDPDPSRRAIRAEFLVKAIELAAEIEADCVSFWSGILPDNASEDAAFDRLAMALKPVIECAENDPCVLLLSQNPACLSTPLSDSPDLTNGLSIPCLI